MVVSTLRADALLPVQNHISFVLYSFVPFLFGQLSVDISAAGTGDMNVGRLT